MDGVTSRCTLFGDGDLSNKRRWGPTTRATRQSIFFDEVDREKDLMIDV
jgi:hypothetical protein